MRESVGRGPTRVEVLGPRPAVEHWTEITAGHDVQVLTATGAAHFPNASSDLAVALVTPAEAAALAAAIAARAGAATPPIALLVSSPDGEHALTAFARTLAQAKHEWEQAFDAIVDPVIILAADGRVRRANRALAQRLDRPFDQFIGVHYAEILGAAIPALDPIAEALSTGQALVHERRFANLKGIFQVTLSPLSWQHDRPGVVGTVGRILGEHEINIAGMQVSRTAQGGHALIALTVDTAIPADVMDEIVTGIGAHDGRAIDL